MRFTPYLSLFALALVGCGDDPAPLVFPADSGADASTADTGSDAATSDTVEQPLLVPEFGREETRQVRGYAGTSDGLNRPLDLEFNPESPADLWVSSQGNDGIVILFDVGSDDQTSDLRLDAFRNHFLEAVSSIAFGAPGLWGSCQESRNTYDQQAPPNDFMGPALWPTDLDVFARAFQDPFGTDLGSHMDMLHESPDCMGIAHYEDNKYFVFDGLNGHMVYYDFVDDHGPGQDDHTDGIVRRYPEVSLTRVAGVPGHMEYHEESGRIFIADTGAGRVMSFTVGTGTHERDLFPTGEPLAEFSEYRGAEVEIFAAGLQQPSGLAINENRLFIGDHATGLIHAYDIDTGEELGSFDTETSELAGITVGPDGTLWFIDAEFSEVLQLAL